MFFLQSEKVGRLLKLQENKGKIIAAICAAPTALKSHGIFKNKQLTSYPAMKDQLTDFYQYLEDDVVIDGTINIKLHTTLKLSINFVIN